LLSTNFDARRVPNQLSERNFNKNPQSFASSAHSWRTVGLTGIHGFRNGEGLDSEPYGCANRQHMWEMFFPLSCRINSPLTNTGV
jgi:hypothetical protein